MKLKEGEQRMKIDEGCIGIIKIYLTQRRDCTCTIHTYIHTYKNPRQQKHDMSHLHNLQIHNINITELK